jgi:predicted MFS family arabinose efflux permease
MPYGTVLTMPEAVLGYVATFAYMIAFYQTYTFLGDHVRQLHHVGAWLGGTISLAYGVGFGAGAGFDKWIDDHGPRRLLPYALLVCGLNYLALPFAAESPWAMAAYPFLWGLANHLCMTSLVTFLGSLAPEKRGLIMGLFSFVTYVALGVAGAVYGSVYAAHGFYAVSFAATATLWAAALLAWLGISRGRQP